MRERDQLRTMPVQDYVAATSVGIVEGEPMLDLAYIEDSKADVDMNIVKTGAGLYIELQGTAEALPFGREALNRLLDLGDTGIRQLIALQRGLVGSDPWQVIQARDTSRRDNQPRQAPGDSRGAHRHPLRTHHAAGSCRRCPSPRKPGLTFGENARLKADLLRSAAGAIRSARANEARCSPSPRIRGSSLTRCTASPACARRASCGPDASYPERFVELNRRLAAQPDEPRTARYICALAVIRDGKVVYETTGAVQGEIAEEPKGDRGLWLRPDFLLPALQEDAGRSQSGRQAGGGTSRPCLPSARRVAAVAAYRDENEPG